MLNLNWSQLASFIEKLAEKPTLFYGGSTCVPAKELRQQHPCRQHPGASIMFIVVGGIGMIKWKSVYWWNFWVNIMKLKYVPWSDGCYQLELCHNHGKIWRLIDDLSLYWDTTTDKNPQLIICTSVCDKRWTVLLYQLETGWRTWCWGVRYVDVEIFLEWQFSRLFALVYHCGSSHLIDWW